MPHGSVPEKNKGEIWLVICTLNIHALFSNGAKRTIRTKRAGRVKKNAAEPPGYHGWIDPKIRAINKK